MAYDKTSVPVERSQGSIREILRKHGARKFAFGQDDDGERIYALIRFEHEGISVRMRVPLKEPDYGKLEEKAERARSKTYEAMVDEAEEQEAKRIWRVIFYNLKARMESVEEEVETFVEAFMAHVINPGTGRTIYEDLVATGSVELPEPLPVQAALPAGR